MTENQLVIDKILGYHRIFLDRERIADHKKWLQVSTYDYVMSKFENHYENFEEYLQEETDARPFIINYLVCQLNELYSLEDGIEIVISFGCQSAGNCLTNSYFTSALKEIISLDQLKKYHPQIKQIYQVWLKLDQKADDQIFDDPRLTFGYFADWLLSYQTSCWDEINSQQVNSDDHDPDSFSIVYQKLMSD